MVEVDWQSKLSYSVQPSKYARTMLGYSVYSLSTSHIHVALIDSIIICYLLNKKPYSCINFSMSPYILLCIIVHHRMWFNVWFSIYNEELLHKGGTNIWRFFMTMHHTPYIIGIIRIINVYVQQQKCINSFAIFFPVTFDMFSTQFSKKKKITSRLLERRASVLSTVRY